MKEIKAGLGRIYNARKCSLLNTKELAMKFILSDIEVNAIVGPELRHSILGLPVGPPMPKDAEINKYITRAKRVEFPSPEVFPADMYLEIIATKRIIIEDDLAESFSKKEKNARGKILKVVENDREKLSKTIDYVAGVIGLQIHKVLVDTPILEQLYAYRENGISYAISTNFNLITTDHFTWDNKSKKKNELETIVSQDDKNNKWEASSHVLSWLLRSWSAEDNILKFVSLFICLECVIPKMTKKEEKNWKKNREYLTELVKENAKQEEIERLTTFIDQMTSKLPLSDRFKNWASNIALPEWEKDVIDFKKFYYMRNVLVHAGKSDFNSQITIAYKHIQSLEDIVERYVSVALFGDANL